MLGRFVSSFVAVVVSSGLVGAEGFNLDLGGTFFVPTSSYSAASGQAGEWNPIESGSTQNILNTAGASTSVNVNVIADGNGSAAGCTNDHQPLVSDMVFTTMGTWTVVLTGLAAGDYQVYIYAPYHDAVPTGNMNVNGVPISSILGTVDCSLQTDVSHVSVRVQVTSGSLTLSGDYLGTGFDYAGVAAIQVCDFVFKDGLEYSDASAWSNTVP